jgi:LysM repeat protein
VNGHLRARDLILSGLAGTHPEIGGVEPDDHRQLVYLIVVGLTVLLFAVVIVAATTLTGSGPAPSAAATRADKLRAHAPAWWTVHSGDTYDVIAAKTGLTTDELETYNPYVDPSALVPGQRLKLRLHPPKVKPKPHGPNYYTLRAGDSFGSIAARFGSTISHIQKLNPKLKPTLLHPGDHVRLR